MRDLPCFLKPPFHKLELLSDLLSINLYSLRDDLIPHFLGGSKVRKLYSFISEIDWPFYANPVFITNGSNNSNHARALALIGRYLDIPVHLILHGAPTSFPSDLYRSNSWIQHQSGASIVNVPASSISGHIRSLHDSLVGEGFTPIIVPGGCHCAPGALAYELALLELPFRPDYILLPSGTGGTQAGLINGIRNLNWSTKVFGISIARSAHRGILPIKDLLYDPSLDSDIFFFDDFRFGGYGLYSTELVEFVKHFTTYCSLPLDLAYTGKALFALFSLVQDNLIPSNSTVVFWSTGGNLI